MNFSLIARNVYLLRKCITYVRKQKTRYTGKYFCTYSCNQAKLCKHTRCRNLRYHNVSRGFHAQLDCKLTNGNENQYTWRMAGRTILSTNISTFDLTFQMPLILFPPVRQKNRQNFHKQQTGSLSYKSEKIFLCLLSKICWIILNEKHATIKETNITRIWIVRHCKACSENWGCFGWRCKPISHKMWMLPWNEEKSQNTKFVFLCLNLVEAQNKLILLVVILVRQEKHPLLLVSILQHYVMPSKWCQVSEVSV